MEGGEEDQWREEWKAEVRGRCVMNQQSDNIFACSSATVLSCQFSPIL